MKLQPRSYRFTKDDSYAQLGLPDGDHFGLIAQEVEAVLPNLVVEVVHPPEHDESGNEIRPSFNTKGINYVELIPLLLQAVQEQQARIEELEAAVGVR